jgi:hypothetical protein
MRIALKYGLLITLVVVVWVVVARFLFPVGPKSSLNVLAPVIFNLAEILAILFGIRARQRESSDELNFKEGTKTGLSIAFVYALSSCLFFFLLFVFVGSKLMASEPMAQTRPMWQVALLAYAGLFFGALIFGLIYSAIISFVLVRRRQV